MRKEKTEPSHGGEEKIGTGEFATLQTRKKATTNERLGASPRNLKRQDKKKRDRGRPIGFQFACKSAMPATPLAGETSDSGSHTSALERTFALQTPPLITTAT